MTLFLVRFFVFMLFPLLLTWILLWADRSVTSRARKLEVALIFLFALSVGGGGIANFFGHFFLSDMVAEFIGWEAGNPFQLEVAFANLAIGILGIVAVGRRDGFREATVLALTIFAVGATIVHLMDIASTGNLAPGNSLQNVSNLVRPALMIGFLLASRRAEADPQAEAKTAEFDRWRAALLQTAAPLSIAIFTAYGLGFAVGQPWPLTLLGAAIGVGVVIGALNRSPYHELRWGRN